MRNGTRANVDVGYKLQKRTKESRDPSVRISVSLE